MHTFTDAEQAFADSPEGRAAIAYERSKFEMGQAHLGDRAQRWNDMTESAAVRRLSCDHARAAVHGAAFLADAARQLPQLAADAEAARQRSIANLNAHRTGR